MQGMDRRELGKGVAYLTTALLGQRKPEEPIMENRSPFVITNDGTRLFVQDWGNGRPVVFLSAWTFHSNVWGSYVATLTARGFRCIAPDRRGHGRSEAPNGGNDLDTLTDDVGDCRRATRPARRCAGGSLDGFHRGGPGLRRTRIQESCPACVGRARNTIHFEDHQ